MSGRRPSSPAAAGTSGRCSPSTCVAAGYRVRVLDLIDAPTTGRPTSSSCGATSATPPRSRGPSTASTSSSTTSRRCRWPGTGSCSSRSTSAGPRCCCARASDGRRRQGRPHLVVSAVFGVPGRQPGLPRATEPSPRSLRAREARRRAALPRGGRPRARRHGRAAAHDPGPRAARHLRDPVRLDRRRRDRARARRRRQPLPVRPRRRPRRRVPAGRPSGRVRPIYHVGAERFGTMREALEALCRHAGTGARVRSVPAASDGARDAAQRGARPDPLRAVPLDHVRRSRCGSTSSPARDELGWRAALVQRGDARASPTTGSWRGATSSQAGASVHRRPAAQGLVRLAKRLL